MDVTLQHLGKAALDPESRFFAHRGQFSQPGLAARVTQLRSYAVRRG
jgi:hypothetical protein